MNVEEYISRKKELYDILHQFIEYETEIEYNQLIKYIKNQNILESVKELRSLLKLLIKITNNYHRYSDFLDKIKKIILDIKSYIRQQFNDSEIFNLFKSNKLLLLFLIENQLITIDETIFHQIFEIGDTIFTKYCHFFYPEVKKFIDEDTQKSIEEELIEIDPDIFVDFEEKREKGQNHSYLAFLIRNDSVEEFIAHISKQQISPSSIIEGSIFETNSFLIKHQASLIEYAAFFGSIQIFQYLRLNYAKLSPLLWNFVIHGKNAELIHVLEENNVDPIDNSFLNCLKESIKCHHNEIANYLIESFLNEDDLDEKFIEFGLHYYNYHFVPIKFDFKLLLYYANYYDQFEIVNLLLKSKKIEINEKLISKINIINQVFFIFLFMKFNANYLMKFQQLFQMKFFLY